MISVDNNTINFSFNSKSIRIENLIIVGSEARETMQKISDIIANKFEVK